MMTALAAYSPSFASRPAGLRQRAITIAIALFDQVRQTREHTWTFVSAMVRRAEDATPAVSQETSRRFQSVIVPHLDSAYNFARYLSRDPDAASDIVQEAFLRAYRSFEGFRGGDARAWMFAIIRNCHNAWHNDGRRKARYEVSMTADTDDADNPANRIAAETDTPEASTMRDSESARVRRVVQGLPEPMREVLVLREFEDFSYKQISEVLDIPVGTVMSRLARARAEFGAAWHALEASEEPR